MIWLLGTLVGILFFVLSMLGVIPESQTPWFALLFILFLYFFGIKAMAWVQTAFTIIRAWGFKTFFSLNLDPREPLRTPALIDKIIDDLERGEEMKERFWGLVSYVFYQGFFVQRLAAVLAGHPQARAREIIWSSLGLLQSEIRPSVLEIIFRATPHGDAQEEQVIRHLVELMSSRFKTGDEAERVLAQYGRMEHVQMIRDQTEKNASQTRGRQVIANIRERHGHQAQSGALSLSTEDGMAGGLSISPDTQKGALSPNQTED